VFQLYHIVKEINMCANYLGKLGIRSISDLSSTFDPLIEFLLLLTMDDSMFVVYHRSQ